LIFGNLVKRASPENPTSSLSNPANWVWDAFGASESVSGVTVNERTALNYSAFWACVRYLSNAIAVPPLKVYKRQGKGREAARDHRNWVLLHDRPNAAMTSFQFRQVAQAHLMTWGNFYAEREMNGRGETVGLWPLRPDRVDVVIRGREKHLAYRLSDGGIVALNPGEFLHIAGLGFDGFVGYSPVSLMREAIGLGMSGESYGARFFGSGGRVPYVVTSPVRMTPEAQDRWRKQWEQVHGGAGDGLKRAQRVALLDEGMSVQSIGMPHDDSQFLETRRFQVEEMARINGVPQHKIQSLEKADFSNIEQQAIEAVQDAVQPWATNWEQVLNWELFTPAERKVYYCEFNLDVHLRGDSMARAESLAIQRQWGIVNADEWREKENMNPLPDGQGEKYLVPLNMMDSADMSAGESVDVAPDRSIRAVAAVGNDERSLRSAESRHRFQKAYAQLFERAAQHFVTREARAAARALARAFKGDRPVEDLMADLRKFYASFGESVRREMLPVVLALAHLVRREIEIETGSAVAAENVERFAQRYVNDFADKHIGDSMGQVRALLEEVDADELQGVLEQRFSDWETDRAAKIGATESVKSGNALSVVAYGMAGVLTLVWRTISQNCPLCNQMNGRTVGTGGKFLHKGDTVQPDDEDTQPLVVRRGVRHPPLHRGCDCVVGRG